MLDETEKWFTEKDFIGKVYGDYKITDVLFPELNEQLNLSWVFACTCERDPSNGKGYIFKFIRPDTVPEEEVIGEREANQIAGSFPYAITARDVVEFPNAQPHATIGLIMERCVTDAVQELTEKNQPFSEEDVKNITFTALLCLQHMHGNRFVHRDIKPDNILLKMYQGKWEGYLGDFGFMKELPPDGYFTENKGTNGYKAPEMVDGYPYTEKADMYSLGVAIFMMLVWDFFWPAEVRQKMESRGISEAAINLVESLLEEDADLRLSAEDALRHPWYDGICGKRSTKNDIIGHVKTLMQEDEEDDFPTV